MPAETNQIEPKTKQTIAQKFADLSAAGLSLGMGGVLAATMLALASPNGINDQQLTILLGSLGANWISTAVWELRAKLRQKVAVAPDLRPIAEEWQAQLSDERLGEILQKLGVMDETLKALEKQPDKTAGLIKELNDVNQKAIKNLEQAMQKLPAGNTVRVRIEQVIGSVVLTAGGDITNVSITNNFAEAAETRRLENIKSDISAHKRALRKNTSQLELRSFQGVLKRAIATGGMSKLNQLGLDSIYTPLLTQVSQANKKMLNERNPRDMKKSLAQEGFPASAETITCIRALNETPRAILLGKAGSGKSTVLAHLTLGLCQDSNFDGEWSFTGMLPLQVMLRQFARFARAESQKVCQSADERESQKRFREDCENGRCGPLLVFVKTHLRDESGNPLTRLAEALEEWLETHGAVWMLDGLDEVPAVSRSMLKRMVEDLAQKFPRCKIFLASRPYSYTPKSAFRFDQKPFAELQVLPFTPAQASIFVHKWYAQMPAYLDGGMTETYAAKRAGELAQKIETRKQLTKLAESPLLLTMMVSLHSAGRGELPEDRWELLKEIVDLLLVTWQKPKSDGEAEPYLGPTKDHLIQSCIEQAGEETYESLYQLAFEVHANPDRNLGEDEGSDILEEEVNTAIRHIINSEQAGDRLRSNEISDDDLKSYLRDRAGLLIDDGDDDSNDPARSRKYRFPHRMFQEYMAAMHKRSEKEDIAPRIDGDPERWREVYALIALMKGESETADCVSLLCPNEPQTQKDWERVYLAAEIWTDKRPSLRQMGVTKIKTNIAKLHGWLTDRMLGKLGGTPSDRAEAGRKLAALPNPDPNTYACADHRHAACANLLTAQGRAAYLQDGFVDVVYAPFTMQAGQQNAGRAPAFSPIRMAKTPVTVAQFGAFVQAGGYDTPEFWNWSPNAEEWLKRTQRKAPHYWNDARFHHLNSPVVGVTWYEAMTFCRWLTRVCWPAANQSHRQGSWFDLPTELEWEFAARGTEGRPYAFSKTDEWQKGDELKCNVHETGIGATSAAGMFVDGATPQGIFDMTGNVWEWMRNEWDDDWNTARKKMDIKGDNLRALRGGSFNYDQYLARCAYRGKDLPDVSSNGYGFRVVVRAHKKGEG